jgi:hygromycin-B 4-O-kinase
MQVKKVKNFLHQKFDTKITDLTYIDKGEWSNTFFFKAGQQDLVIRLSKLEENFLKDKFAYEQYTNKIPIPKILQIDKFSGMHYAISERAFGKFIDNLDRQEMQIILPALFSLFDQMRELDTSESKGFGNWNKHGDGGFDSWRSYLLDVINDSPDKPTHGWKQNLINSKFGLADFEKIYVKLQECIDYCPEMRHVIHSDLIYFNLLVSDSAEKIASVLDWGCAKYGDFLYDIAWFDFWKFWYPSMKDVDFSKIARQHLEQQNLPTENIKNFERRMLCYKIHIALDSLVYSAFKENWEFYETVLHSEFIPS